MNTCMQIVAVFVAMLLAAPGLVAAQTWSP